MQGWEDANVSCPYYVRELGAAIKCRGLDKYSVINVTFRDPITGGLLKEKKEIYSAEKCQRDYEACPIYKMLERVWEK